MKKKIFTATFMGLVLSSLVVNASFAASCTLTPTCSGASSYERVGKFCSSYAEAGGYYNKSGEKVCFLGCASCPQSSTLGKQDISLGAGHYEDLGCDSVNVYTCVPKEECWAGTYGFVNVEANEFFCQSCPEGATSPDGATDVTQCFCEVGYYGTISSASDTCTRCPSLNGVYGTTKSSGATSVSECYIPSGRSIRDATGSYTYSIDCYY